MLGTSHKHDHQRGLALFGGSLHYTLYHFEKWPRGRVRFFQLDDAMRRVLCAVLGLMQGQAAKKANLTAKRSEAILENG
ncbi:hypothetical protein BJF93_00170 [Xaviernesmea oryzae]|uniref:Uncharacterized protein n=1 Tax=Xaviernesmea oryzae TaxID=464029 RepID=A0A1Q9B096_9HYPH|nr:hypothetical protein BJF93_00170 [Xaviernesmea oryzae]